MEAEMEHQCRVTEMQHIKGEVNGLKARTEMEHLNSNTIKQYHRDDIHSNKSSLNFFHQNIQSLRNKKVNLKILLNTNLLSLDVLGFTEHWLIDVEISSYNLPNFSLVRKNCRQNKRNGSSCIYVRSNILAKLVTKF
jgi:hypothetical protein